MLAAVFQGKNKIGLENCEVRPPQSGEVVVKVAVCGVCGTDQHIFHGDEGAAPTPPGVILGHEFAGTVVEIASDVKNIAIGDRVCVDPNDYCGACYYCREGKANFCENMIGIGTTTHGGFAEYCTVKAKQVYKISPKLSFSVGAMAEPVACCLHGMDLCSSKSGATVLVIGGGTIGLIMLQLVRLAGAARIALIEPDQSRYPLARSLGADLCMTPEQAKDDAFLIDSGIRAFDVTIECVGLGSTVSEAIRLCGKGGTVMMFGLTPPDCTISLSPFEVFRKELHLTASFINPYTMQRALDLLESGKILIEELLGEALPLNQIHKVFYSPEELKKKGKTLILPGAY